MAHLHSAVRYVIVNRADYGDGIILYGARTKEHIVFAGELDECGHHVHGAQRGDYRLIYLGEHQPKRWLQELPDGSYEVDIIGTWNMIITPTNKVYRWKTEIELGTYSP